MDYATILVETHGRVGLITLNRPEALNALSAQLIAEVSVALDGFETDDSIGAVMITGSAKAFAAGGDIREMAGHSFVSAYLTDVIAPWDRVARFRKPLIAAVAGFALGGGCELAMMCDLILAAETAQFGQPEIQLGILPGAGGTQRLARTIGKAKTMDMVLTGRRIGAAEAERDGLVARVLPADNFVAAALAIAAEIAAKPLVAAMLAKEAVNLAFETGLEEGLRFERRLFQAVFATEDQKTGMAAFAAKQKPDFRHR
jgi:enoyl-CoA hydratase